MHDHSVLCPLCSPTIDLTEQEEANHIASGVNPSTGTPADPGINTPERRHEDEQLADILDRAADLLETHGRCTEQLVDKATGELCLVGALMKASDEHEVVGKRRRRVYRHMLDTTWLEMDLPRLWLSSWNDSKWTTDQQILDALRLGAKNARMPKPMEAE